MVSYMDIMTLLLTFFVLLLVYTRAMAPDAAAATTAHRSPSLAEMPREPSEARHAVDPPAIPSIAAVASLVESPPLGPTIHVGELPVTNPTVTVAVETEPVGSPSPAVEVAVADSGHEQPASPAEPADAAVRAPHPTADGPMVVADVTTQDTAHEPADVTAVGLPSPTPPPALAAEPLPDVPADVSSAPAAQPDESLLAAIRSSALGQRVEVSIRKDAVSLEISDEILFDRGSAGLTPSGEKLLADLATLLAPQAVRISVEGHTDDRPIRTARFASNWELSAARATNVTRALIAHAVDPARVRAVGYADTRPRADNGSEPGRARNRRVALVLHVPTGSEAAW